MMCVIVFWQQYIYVKLWTIGDDVGLVDIFVNYYSIIANILVQQKEHKLYMLPDMHAYVYEEYIARVLP